MNIDVYLDTVLRRIGKNPFKTAVVLDYITDPGFFTEEMLASSYDKNITIDAVKRAPPGSVIAQIKGVVDTPRIFYPFFSSHISLPVKPNENVWCFQDNESGTTQGMYYWISRKIVDYGYEDPNRTNPLSTLIAKETSSVTPASQAFVPASSVDLTSSKSSTRGVVSDNSLSNLPGSLTVEAIISNASCKEEIVDEPVPLYRASSTEISIQGSNNTGIVQGVGFDGNLAPNSGFIDLSTGKGQTESTSPVILDENGQQIASRETFNDQEGKADVVNDRSRILLSSLIDADSTFSLEVPGVDPSQAGCIVQKSDKIRIIARQDVAITVEGSSGASVVVNSNGDIYLTPSASGKVYLSGPESDQAYLRYDDLREVVNGIEGLINSLIASIKLITQATPGASALAESADAIVDDFTKIENAMITIKSGKILGS